AEGVRAQQVLVGDRRRGGRIAHAQPRVVLVQVGRVVTRHQLPQPGHPRGEEEVRRALHHLVEVLRRPLAVVLVHAVAADEHLQTSPLGLGEGTVLRAHDAPHHRRAGLLDDDEVRSVHEHSSGLRYLRRPEIAAVAAWPVVWVKVTVNGSTDGSSSNHGPGRPCSMLATVGCHKVPVPGPTIQRPTSICSWWPALTTPLYFTQYSPWLNSGLLQGPNTVMTRSDIGAVAPANSVISTVVPDVPVISCATVAESSQNPSVSSMATDTWAMGSSRRRVKSRTSTTSPRACTLCPSGRVYSSTIGSL